MAQKLTIKRGDKHGIEFTIVNPPTNLSGGTAKIFVTPSIGGNTVTFNGSLAGNTVTWTLDGSLDVGKYRLEVQVTAGEFIVTAPSGGYMELVVVQDLAD